MARRKYVRPAAWISGPILLYSAAIFLDLRWLAIGVFVVVPLLLSTRVALSAPILTVNVRIVAWILFGLVATPAVVYDLSWMTQDSPDPQGVPLSFWLLALVVLAGCGLWLASAVQASIASCARRIQYSEIYGRRREGGANDDDPDG